MQRPFEFTTKTMMAYHAILVFSFLYFLFVGTYSEWLIILGIVSLRTLISTTIIHRKIAHKAFEIPKWLEYFLSSLATAGGNSSILSWVAVHRKHHRFSDKDKDPHSPIKIGFVKIHTRAMEEKVELSYAVDIIRSKFYMWCHINHWLISAFIVGILFAIDYKSVLYIWLVPNFIQWHLGALVNYMNHTSFGYRNYQTDDISNNNPITGVFMMGEGWHNNHHAEPGNPRFGHRWYELDIGWWFIKLIRTNR